MRSIAPNPKHSAASAEWYTPPEVVAIAREYLEEIDLDPASCEEANKTIGAATFYAADGLKREWAGRVFLNPPTPPRLWWERLVREFASGKVHRAVFLAYSLEQIPQSIGWGLPMTSFPILFRPGGKGRIPFIRPGGDRGAAPPHASALVFLGTMPKLRDGLVIPAGLVVSK